MQGTLPKSKQSTRENIVLEQNRTKTLLKLKKKKNLESEINVDIFIQK